MDSLLAVFIILQVAYDIAIVIYLFYIDKGEK
jgi:hypothetical protein